MERADSIPSLGEQSPQASADFSRATHNENLLHLNTLRCDRSCSTAPAHTLIYGKKLQSTNNPLHQGDSSWRVVDMATSNGAVEWPTLANSDAPSQS